MRSDKRTYSRDCITGTLSQLWNNLLDIGNVLSQSGSYWWRPPDDAEPHWLARQFEAALPLPLRFYVDVGSLESDGHRRANERLRDALQGKGYPVRYAEQGKGYPVRYAEFWGGHTFLCWQGTLSDGLLGLLGGGAGTLVPAT